MMLQPSGIGVEMIMCIMCAYNLPLHPFCEFFISYFCMVLSSDGDSGSMVGCPSERGDPTFNVKSAE